MLDFLMETYAVVLPVFTTYIVWVLKQQRKERKQDNKERDQRIAEENKKREANAKGTMLILRVQLIEYHDKYMKRKSIPSYVYENFMEMYEAYHELGGNGMVTHMKEEIERLTIKKDKGDEL